MPSGVPVEQGPGLPGPAPPSHARATHAAEPNPLALLSLQQNALEGNVPMKTLQEGCRFPFGCSP